MIEKSPNLTSGTHDTKAVSKSVVVLSRIHVPCVKTHDRVVLGCELPRGRSFYNESSEVNKCQIAYLVDGLTRFDSVGLQTPREHSPHTLEHSCKALQRRISEDRNCVSWRGVVFVENTALIASGDTERMAWSTTAVAHAVYS